MIVVSGEALFDVYRSADTPSGVLLDARIGGSPLNVAMGLARLSQPVAFFGALARGGLGARLRQALQAEGVDTVCSMDVDAPPTLSLVDVASDGGPSYVFYGHGGADRCLPLSALARVPTPRACTFGSYTLVVEPVATTLRALVEREHTRCLIAYDPNIRLNVEPDLARWRDVLSWMLPRTHLLKISDEDLHALYPGVDPALLVPQWLAAGVRLVVLTRGAQGATAWTAAAQVSVPGRPVQVVDTVGAGDTFQAALLTALAERDLLSPQGLGALGPDMLREVLDFACHAAAITCSRRGADLPRRNELPRPSPRTDQEA
ncbi:MAG TPA: carbohydrate kinase [Burkholderiaceae bacterium]|nr:carbohydrate kinase [Burkholderiaceae bacterium]